LETKGRRATGYVSACGIRGGEGLAVPPVTLRTLAAIRLAPGAWVLQVVVGAEEGDAATYEIDVAWDGKTNGPDLAFQSLQLAVRKT
jgi:hypothetical protein